MLKHELDMQLEDLLFWTDSMTVLKYIENYAAQYKTFVANRVSLIREGLQVVTVEVCQFNRESCRPCLKRFDSRESYEM